jgi:hypothetical protein
MRVKILKNAHINNQWNHQKIYLFLELVQDVHVATLLAWDKNKHGPQT